MGDRSDRGEQSPNLDYHSRRGAEILSRRIETYWRSLGFNIRTWLVPFESTRLVSPESTRLVSPESSWLVPPESSGEEPQSARAANDSPDGALWLVRSSLANGLPPGRSNPFFGSESRSFARGCGGGHRSRAQLLADPAPLQPPEPADLAREEPTQRSGAAEFHSPPTW